MTPQEAIDTIKIAIAEVEWDYPMDYAVAFEEAIKALEIADRLEQADAEEMAIRIGCSKCRHTMCRRNPKYEGEQDLFEVRCDLFRRFKNDAILVLEDIRGEE